MRIVLHQTLSELPSLTDAWRKLIADGGGFRIFDSPDWVLPQFDLDPTLMPHVLAVYADQELTGVFPFAIKTRRYLGATFRELVHAAGDAADYASFPLHPAANRGRVVREVVRWLTDNQAGDWDFYHIEGLSERDAVAQLFRLTLLTQTYGHSRIGALTSHIDFTLPYERTSKTRANAQRRLRKLERELEISITIGGNLTPAILNEFRDLHAAGFPDYGFNLAAMQSFYQSLAESEDFRNKIEVSYISHAGRVIAGHFGFADGESVYYYVPVYDQAYQSHGPGKSLLLMLIEHYQQAGYRYFDFLRGWESYKQDWANAASGNHTVFGCAENAGLRRKLMVNLLAARRSLPCFSRLG